MGNFLIFGAAALAAAIAVICAATAPASVEAAAALWLCAGLALACGVLLGAYAMARRKAQGAIIRRMRDLCDNRASFTTPMDHPGGDLDNVADGFNEICTKVSELLCIGKGYLNMLDAVPDPVFAVDEDFNILHANSELAQLAGVDVRKIRGSKCSDLLDSGVCGTDLCPLCKAKQLQEGFEAEVLTLNTPNGQRFIKPVGDVLYDCHGEQIGYLVVARDVTNLVRKEAEVQGQLDRQVAVAQRINEASTGLSRSADSLADQVEQVGRGSRRQNERITETTRDMEHMNESVLQVAQNAADAAGNAETSQARAREGADRVSSMARSIEGLRGELDGLSASMGDLGTRAEGIGAIIDVISDIADQTNLLALNAAIEAARAGDAGRGFAVVADEVRKLAEKTMTATREVELAVDAIQRGTRDNVERTGHAVDEIAVVSELADASRASLDEIVGLAETTAEQVRSIATAARRQSETSQRVHQAMDEVAGISEETDQGMGDAARAVDEVAALASRLRELAEETD